MLGLEPELCLSSLHIKNDNNSLWPIFLQKEKLNNCEFLLEYQKKQLLPENGDINLQELGFTMHMNILKLLKGNANTGIISYMKQLRNRLCHASFISLEQGTSQQEFRRELDLMEFNFIRRGVDITLANTCKNDILNRI